MMERSPGTYGPEFLEPGFKENGSYFDAGLQVNVNPYGGNLTISAKDVSIPSQGKFELAFTRTFNSNSLYLPGMGISNQADSPLGEGWVGHYGILWAAGTPLPGGGPVPHPEFVDSSGARHRFYRHDLLNTEIPISSPGNNDEWISASMEILLKIDNDTYELLTPNGLKYTLERLYTTDTSTTPPQSILRYFYFVTTQVSDCYGNTWEIVYEEDITPYFEHPLVQSINDGFGRTLNFEYDTDQLGKRRLYKVRFNGKSGKILAEYDYEPSGTHA